MESIAVIRLKSVIQDLGGVVELLEALSNEGREDASALRLLSHVVGGAFIQLEEIAVMLEEELSKSA